jgi:transcriptional regulator with XRE-family HTH domain
LDPTIRTPGQQALIDWLKAEPGRSQGSVATALGVSQPAVGYWVKGTSRPEAAKRAALFALCGIPESDWETNEERQQRAEALARIAKGTGGEAA